MAQSPRELIRQVLTALGKDELRRARGMVGSRTLSAAMRLLVEESNSRARLFIPHYWAVYYHDGRGGVSPVSARKLVFFDDPRDDPRLASGFPERAGQIQRLTRSQYEKGLRMNRARAEAGRRPFMYVVDRVGPAAGRPFFDRLSRGAARRADPTVCRIFDQHIQEIVDEEARRPGAKGSARFRLR